MSYGGWYSKKDVLKDLRKATGKRVLDIDEGSVLVGEQPPPQRYNAIDEEAELQLLRLYGGCKPAAPDSVITPDLAGITQMLRMVDDLVEKEPQPETPKPTENLKNLITISKLNPEVKEFVPKSNISNETTLIKETISNGTGTICTAKESISNNTVKTDGCDTITLSERRIDRNQLTEKEIKEMRVKLKSKISDTSNAACVTVIRERNIAIASLLKLYCQTPTPAVEQKPKLISPAYFEKSKEKYPIENSSPKGKEIEKKIIEKICPLQETSTENLQNDVISNDLKVEETHVSNIAASVDKVQKWLRDSEDTGSSKTTTEKPGIAIKVDDEDEKKKVSKTNGHVEQADKKGTLYLGAITFKRKTCSSKPASPTSTDSTERSKVENGKTTKCAVYKPSAYATELSKKYLERSKVQESLKQDFWTRIETQLKAKDEEIKNKQARELEAQPEDSIG